MRLYAAVARSEFRRFATYRAATFGGVLANTVFGFIMAYTYIALWDQRPHLGGYDVTAAVTYVFLGQALLSTVAIFGGGFQDDLAERIRTGDIAIDLYRPIDLQLWWIAGDFGRAGFQLLLRGVPPMAAGALAFDLVLPGNPVRWLMFLVSVVLGVLVSFSIRYLVVLSGFWLMDVNGVRAAASVIALFFSGNLLPLNIFPDGLRQVAEALPWSAMLQIPADVYLGRHTGAGLLGVLGFQLGWAVVLLAAGRALGAVATRKVVVQGG
jgi:ABC-2 type transport system permease protein